MNRIGDYEIVSRIASGGMGTVYLAHHLHTRRNVAFKVLAPRANDDLEFVARFRREGHAIASLDHPHIVKVYDAGCADGDARGICYLAMEYLNYGTLKERMQKFKAQGECMPVNEALEIVLRPRKVMMAGLIGVMLLAVVMIAGVWIWQPLRELLRCSDTQQRQRHTRRPRH